MILYRSIFLVIRVGLLAGWLIVIACSGNEYEQKGSSSQTIKPVQPSPPIDKIAEVRSEEVNTVHRVRELLQGNIGSSEQFQCGWLDLDRVMDFHQGDTLIIAVGGSAQRVVVRLLPRDGNPNSPSGVDGGIVDVPNNRRLVLELEQDHLGIGQISIHGGPNPWGIFSIDPANGPAMLQSVSVSHRGM